MRSPLKVWLLGLLLLIYLSLGFAALFLSKWPIPGLLGDAIQDGGHAPYFFLLTLLITWCVKGLRSSTMRSVSGSRTKTRLFIWVPVSLAVSAVFAELFQSLAGRNVSAIDLLANLLGIGAGALVIFIRSNFTSSKSLIPAALIGMTLIAGSFHEAFRLVYWQYTQEPAPVVYDFSNAPDKVLSELAGFPPYVQIHRDAQVKVSLARHPKSCESRSTDSKVHGSLIELTASQNRDWSGLRLQDLHAHAFFGGPNDSVSLWHWLRQRLSYQSFYAKSTLRMQLHNPSNQPLRLHLRIDKRDKANRSVERFNQSTLVASGWQNWDIPVRDILQDQASLSVLEAQSLLEQLILFFDWLPQSRDAGSRQPPSFQIARICLLD